LHRIDRTHLLSIGFDAADRGDFAFFDGLLLQLFDVTRPTEPVLLHREKIGTRGSSSAAATDHLAFNFVADRGLLAIPVTICEGGGDGRFGSTLTFSGLMVYDVSVDNGFHRRGGVDHGTHGASCRAWWSNADSLVKRSVLTRELAFSIAEDRLKVQRLDALGADVADIPLGHPVVPKAPPESSPSLIGLSAVPKPGPSGSVAVTSAVEGGTVANAAAVVAGLRAGFRSCYNAGLKVDPRMSGRVTVLATLAPNGEVASTSIAQTAGISDPVEQCVQRKLRNASFDAPVPARSPAVVRIDLAMTPP